MPGLFYIDDKLTAMPFLSILLAFFIAIASINAKEVQPSPADVARCQAELALAAGHTAEARYWYQEAIGYNGEAAGIGGDPALVYNLAVLNYGDGVTRNLHELLDYAAASALLTSCWAICTRADAAAFRITPAVLASIGSALPPLATIAPVYASLLMTPLCWMPLPLRAIPLPYGCSPRRKNRQATPPVRWRITVGRQQTAVPSR